MQPSGEGGSRKAQTDSADLLPHGGGRRPSGVRWTVTRFRSADVQTDSGREDRPPGVGGSASGSGLTSLVRKGSSPEMRALFVPPGAEGGGEPHAPLGIKQKTLNNCF